jgi:hypothetical protein
VKDGDARWLSVKQTGRSQEDKTTTLAECRRVVDRAWRYRGTIERMTEPLMGSISIPQPQQNISKGGNTHVDIDTMERTLLIPSKLNGSLVAKAPVTWLRCWDRNPYYTTYNTKQPPVSWGNYIRIRYKSDPILPHYPPSWTENSSVSIGVHPFIWCWRRRFQYWFCSRFHITWPRVMWSATDLIFPWQRARAVLGITLVNGYVSMPQADNVIYQDMHIISYYLSIALEWFIITIIDYLGRYNNSNTIQTEQS